MFGTLLEDLEDHPTPSAAPGGAVVRLEGNERGRDFAVGDVHGMFRALEELLAKIGFDESADRLISVGDLIDRGPDSQEVDEWLAKPWLHACRGNHEQMCLSGQQGWMRELWIEHNGGEWWQDIEPAKREAILAALERLPFAMEVETGEGTIGVVHAEAPAGMDWPTFVGKLEEGDRAARLFALWSRERISGAVPGDRVGGIARIVSGHTPVRETVRQENVHYIDTGAAYFHLFSGARLTIARIHPGPYTEYSVKTGPG